MRCAPFLLAGGALLFGAVNAHAHLMNTGLGPFYDGLAHPFVTPEDLLVVMALTLLAGLRGSRCGRWVLFTLPGAWLVGMTAAVVMNPPVGQVWLSCVLTVALGAAVAADRPWPVAVVAGATAVAGAVQGFGNGRELVAAPGGLMAMAGIVCALFVVASLVAGQVAMWRAHGARVAVRVTGSWIAAIGLLMFGWTMR